MSNGKGIAPSSYLIMPKPVGAACNMACSYCYYLEKDRIHGEGRDSSMPENLLEMFIKQYAGSQPSDHVVFNWHGGEPTLRGRDFFTKAVELQKKYAGGRRIENTFQTNGLLIDDEWCAFFKEHHFLIGLSIDGPRHVHDRYRVTACGQAAFDDALKAIELFQRHGVEFNTLSVVNAYSSKYPDEVYMFLKEAGSRHMQFIPAVGCVSDGVRQDSLELLNVKESGQESLAPWSVRPLDYGLFLSGIFDRWIANDVGKYFIQPFESVLCAWCGLTPGICVMQKRCGNAGIVESNGDVFPCDHYVFPEYRLGNIQEHGLVPLFFSERQKKFGAGKYDGLTSYCTRCEFVALCYGECPKNRFSLSPDGEPGHNYLCEGLRYFFRRTEPYMKFMREEIRNGREPSNVMAWAVSKTGPAAPAAKAGANEAKEVDGAR